MHMHNVQLIESGAFISINQSTISLDFKEDSRAYI